MTEAEVRALMSSARDRGQSPEKRERVFLRLEEFVWHTEGEWDALRMEVYNLLDRIRHRMDDEWRYSEAPSGAYQGRNAGYSIHHDDESDDRPRRGSGRKAVTTSAVRVTTADGIMDWTNLANDERAIRAYMESEADGQGWALADLVQAMRPGKPNAENRERRARLSVLVVGVRDRGGTGPALARVIGCSKTAVSTLEAAARNLNV